MTWIIEITLICVLLLGAYYGYAGGFFKLAMQPIKRASGILFALSLCRQVGNTFIAPIIRSSITNYTTEFMRSHSLDKIPTVIKFAAIISGREELIGSGNNAAVAITELTSPLVALIASVLAFLLLIFLAKICFTALVNVTNRLVSVGTIGVINRALGVAFAGFFSLIVVWIMVFIIDMLFHTQTLYKFDFIAGYNPGPIFKTMRDISPLELLLSF